MENIPYALVIGSIIYVILCIKADVSYTLSITSKYHSNLDDGHQKIVKKILKYLRRTNNVFVVHKEHKLVVLGYLNASFQSYSDDRKSEFRYVFTMNYSIVSLENSKQKKIIDFTIEIKYIFMHEVIKVHHLTTCGP